MTSSTGIAPSRARIGRQSIQDRDGRLVGYELHFSPGPALDGEDSHVRDLHTSDVMTKAFGDFGLDRLGHKRHLFVNLTRGFATGAVPLPFTPQNVVLMVLADVEVDLEVLEGLRDLKARGYRLAVDGGVSGDEHEQLLPLVDVIKVDTSVPDPDLPALVEYIRDQVPHVQLMAEGVPDEAGLQAAVAAGFDCFQGWTPDPASAPTAGVRPSQVVSLQLLAALSDPDSTTQQIERIVSADPGLSLRVLGAVNSASGAGREITSLRQALVLLGRRALSSWVMLAAIGGRANSQREQMIDVLTRARACELLSHHVPGLDGPTAYAAGLLSGVVDVMGADAVTVARETRLGPELTAALVQREGDIGTLLASVEEFDRTGRTSAQIPSSEVSRAQLHALGTAVETIDAILGA